MEYITNYYGMNSKLLWNEQLITMQRMQVIVVGVSQVPPRLSGHRFREKMELFNF